jgi:hypothetical protein
VRGALIVLGTLIMGYAVTGALTDPDVKPFGVALFLAAGVVAHDGVLLPLMLGAGAVLDRVVPADAHSAVRAAAVSSVAVTLIGLPLAFGFGRLADNPSVLPRPYGKGLLAVLVVIWVVALAKPVARRIRKHLERSRAARGRAAAG